MISVADALKVLVDSNVLLQTGFRHGLFNLTKLADFLRPQVNARTKKEVSSSALVMALSRLQRGSRKNAPLPQFAIDNIFVTAHLCALSFPNSLAVHRGLHSLSNRLHKESQFMTLTEGAREIAVIFPRDKMELVRSAVPEKPVSAHSALAALSVTFREDYQTSPGFFYTVFQQLFYQNINVVEIASTAHELVLFVHERDARLAFDTLFQRFLYRDGEPVKSR